MDLNTEIKGLFTPKYGFSILKKILGFCGFFSDFLDFLQFFPEFFWCRRIL